jgi:hypothetical protein
MLAELQAVLPQGTRLDQTMLALRSPGANRALGLATTAPG